MVSEPAKAKKRTRPAPSIIEKAVTDVIEKGQSINKTALSFKVSRAYLAKIVKKAKSSDNRYKHKPNVGNKRIFTLEQENLLAGYLKTSSHLTRKQTKELAFQFATAHNISPEKWKKNGCATEDWLKGFMSRHKELSFRHVVKTSPVIITDSPEDIKLEKDEKPKKKNFKKMASTSSDTSNDDNNLALLQVKNGTLTETENEPEQNNSCVVCSEDYKESNEEWYECKLCLGWAHELCGIKGNINFFCQNCF